MLSKVQLFGKQGKSSKAMSIKKRYFSIKELSEYTGLPASTLYEWASLGVIPSIKIRKRVLFDLEDFDAALKSLKRSEQIEIQSVKNAFGH